MIWVDPDFFPETPAMFLGTPNPHPRLITVKDETEFLSVFQFS